MGWRDLLNPTPVEFAEKAEFTPPKTEQIPQNPLIPPKGDSEFPELTLLDHLTEMEREYYLDLVKIMQSPKFGMNRETAEREAGAIVARNRHPLQIKQAAQDYRKNGYIKIYSTVLGQAIYLARDEATAKGVPEQNITTFLESDAESVKKLNKDEIKVLLEARIIFNGPVKVEGHSATPCPQTMDSKQIARNFYGKKCGTN